VVDWDTNTDVLAESELRHVAKEERKRIAPILDNILTTMKHAQTFIASKEKMHRDGVLLYRDCLYDVELLKYEIEREGVE